MIMSPLTGNGPLSDESHFSREIKHMKAFHTERGYDASKGRRQIGRGGEYMERSWTFRSATVRKDAQIITMLIGTQRGHT